MCSRVNQPRALACYRKSSCSLTCNSSLVPRIKRCNLSFNEDLQRFWWSRQAIKYYQRSVPIKSLTSLQVARSLSERLSSSLLSSLFSAIHTYSWPSLSSTHTRDPKSLFIIHLIGCCIVWLRKSIIGCASLSKKVNQIEDNAMANNQ